MIVHGKIWGKTSPLFNKNNVEVHYLEINAGGYCSTHYHQHKYNQFIVLKGSIKVTIKKHYGPNTDYKVIKEPLGVPDYACYAASSNVILNYNNNQVPDNLHDDITTLHTGEQITVSPGELHIFEAIEDSIVLEIYWVELKDDDIIRQNHGGVKLTQL